MSVQSTPVTAEAAAVAGSCTPANIFQDGLQMIYSYCSLVDFRSAFQTCHHYYHTAQRQLPMELSWSANIHSLRVAAARAPSAFLLTHITTLRVVGDYHHSVWNIPVEGLTALLVFTRLRHLIGPRYLVFHFGVIKQMSSLETINIGWMGASGLSVDSLRELCSPPHALTELKEIEFGKSMFMTPEHLEYLAMLPTLTKLSTTMPLATLPSMTAKSFPSLQILILYGVSARESSSWEAVLPLMEHNQCVLPSVVELTLRDMEFRSGDELAQFLLFYPQLRQLTLDHLIIPNLRGLLHLTQLSSLAINNCNLYLTFEHYCELIRLSSLRRLSISESSDVDGVVRNHLTKHERDEFNSPSLLLPRLTEFIYDISSYRSNGDKITPLVTDRPNQTNSKPPPTSSTSDTLRNSKGDVASAATPAIDPTSNPFTLDLPQSTTIASSAAPPSTVTNSSTNENTTFQFTPVTFNFSTSTAVANPFEVSHQGNVFSLPSPSIVDTAAPTTTANCNSSTSSSIAPPPSPLINFSPIIPIPPSTPATVIDDEQVTKLRTQISDLEEKIKYAKHTSKLNHSLFRKIETEEQVRAYNILLTEKRNQLKRLLAPTFHFSLPSTAPATDSSLSSSSASTMTPTQMVVVNPFARSTVQVKRKSRQPTTPDEKPTFVAGTDQDTNKKSAAASSALAAKLDSLSLMALRASVPASSKKTFQSHSLGTILYKDVMIVIFGFLPFQTAIHASRSCTQWYSAACQFKGLKVNWDQMTDMQIFRLVGSPLLRSHVIKLVAPATTTTHGLLFKVSPNPLSNTSLSLIQHHLSQLEELNFRYVISWVVDDEPRIVLPPQLRKLTCTFQAPFVRIGADDSSRMWIQSETIRTRVMRAIEQIVAHGQHIRTLCLETNFIQEDDPMPRQLQKRVDPPFTFNPDTLRVLGQLPQLTNFTTHALLDHDMDTYRTLGSFSHLLHLDTGSGCRPKSVTYDRFELAYATPFTPDQLKAFLSVNGQQTKLQSINLSQLPMTKEFLQQLAEFPQLTDLGDSLERGWAEIEEGVIQQAFKQLSPRLKSFRYFGLDSNLPALFRGLASCCELVELTMNAPTLLDSELCEVLPHLKQLTTLSLTSHALTTFRCLEVSPHLLTSLKVFDIAHHSDALPRSFFQILTKDRRSY